MPQRRDRHNAVVRHPALRVEVRTDAFRALAASGRGAYLRPLGARALLCLCPALLAGQKLRERFHRCSALAVLAALVLVGCASGAPHRTFRGVLALPSGATCAAYVHAQVAGIQGMLPVRANRDLIAQTSAAFDATTYHFHRRRSAIRLYMNMRSATESNALEPAAPTRISSSAPRTYLPSTASSWSTFLRSI